MRTRGPAADARSRPSSARADRQHADRARAARARTSTCTCSPTASRRSPPRWTAKAWSFDVERKRVRKHGEERVFTHIHVQRPLPVRADGLPGRPGPLRLQELDHRQGDRAGEHRRAGAVLARASIPDLDLDEALAEAESKVDRFQIYEMLLLPLENVKQSPKYHPEGDALYHSLQVFDLARDELPYDEEFLLAALLHDVGKAIDPADHVAAGLEALDGFITERTAWLIEHHMLGA